MCWFESSIQENIQHISISSGAGGLPCTSRRATQRSSVGPGAMNQVAGEAGGLTVAAKTNTKFSTLEKSEKCQLW